MKFLVSLLDTLWQGPGEPRSQKMLHGPTQTTRVGFWQMVTFTSLATQSHDPLWCDLYRTVANKSCWNPYGNRSCCRKPLFQSEASWETDDMKIFFFYLMQLKLIFTREVSHVASFWKWEFLELGNCLFLFAIWTHSCLSLLLAFSLAYSK